MREFYQCDFDIAGVYDPMIPDAEILRIMLVDHTPVALFGFVRLVSWESSLLTMDGAEWRFSRH